MQPHSQPASCDLRDARSAAVLLQTGELTGWQACCVDADSTDSGKCCQHCLTHFFVGHCSVRAVTACYKLVQADGSSVGLQTSPLTRPTDASAPGQSDCPKQVCISSVSAMHSLERPPSLHHCTSPEQTFDSGCTVLPQRQCAVDCRHALDCHSPQPRTVSQQACCQQAC